MTLQNKGLKIIIVSIAAFVCVLIFGMVSVSAECLYDESNIQEFTINNKKYKGTYDVLLNYKLEGMKIFTDGNGEEYCRFSDISTDHLTVSLVQYGELKNAKKKKLYPETETVLSKNTSGLTIQKTNTQLKITYKTTLSKYGAKMNVSLSTCIKADEDRFVNLGTLESIVGNTEGSFYLDGLSPDEGGTLDNSLSTLLGWTPKVKTSEGFYTDLNDYDCDYNGSYTDTTEADYQFDETIFESDNHYVTVNYDLMGTKGSETYTINVDPTVSQDSSITFDKAPASITLHKGASLKLSITSSANGTVRYLSNDSGVAAVNRTSSSVNTIVAKKEGTVTLYAYVGMTDKNGEVTGFNYVTIPVTVVSAAHKSEVIPAVSATNTTTGLTKGAKCSICGKILTAQKKTAIISKVTLHKSVDKTYTLTSGKAASWSIKSGKTYASLKGTTLTVKKIGTVKVYDKKSKKTVKIYIKK